MDWIYFAVLGALITGLVTLLLFVKRALDREMSALDAAANTDREYDVRYVACYEGGKLIESQKITAANADDAILATQAWLNVRGTKGTRYEDFQATEVS